MICPNCSQSLITTIKSNQKVLRCTNCGGTFFEENGINRITAGDAQELTHEANTNIVMGTPKVCPIDTIFLHLIDNDEAVPQNVSLFKCPKCHGIFAYPDDLLKFKKAQTAKIEFFKIWETPLASLKTVMVLSFIAVIALTAFSNLSNRSTQTTQAGSLVGNVSFTHEGRYLFVNFKTTTPYMSSIIIHDTATDSVTTSVITEKLATLHYTTISNANTQHELYYQIVLKDDKGNETRTEQSLIRF
ncbi:MAG: zf-TFIIB domain-containing protein [Patescibacteria group bacterium]